MRKSMSFVLCAVVFFAFTFMVMSQAMAATAAVEQSKVSRMALEKTKAGIDSLKAAIKNYEQALKTGEDEHLRQAVENARVAVENAEKSLEHAKLFKPEAATGTSPEMMK